MRPVHGAGLTLVKSSLEGLAMGMLPLDDGMLDDARVAKAGVIGFAVHVAGLLWCSRNNTAIIPCERVSCLLDLSGVSTDDANPAAVSGAPRSMGGHDGANAHEIASHLVDVGLWEPMSVEKVRYEGTPREEIVDSIEAFRILDFAPRKTPSISEGNVIVAPFRQ